MQKSYCKNCQKWLPVNQFQERKDRLGFNAWCNKCSDKNGRSESYPPIEERGYGKV